MTNLDTGTYGAKVQSWKHANPRDVLRRLIAENPKARKEQLLKNFRDQTRDNEELIDSIVEYWFANNYHSLIEGPKDRAARKKARAAAVEKVKEKIQSRLLDMRLPNGLTLAESTFGYVAKLGGGLARIGAKGKPNEVIGKKMSEAEVRKLYGKDD